MPLEEENKSAHNATKEKSTRRRKRHKRKQQKSPDELYVAATAKLSVAMTREKKAEVEKVAVPVAVIQYFLLEAQTILEEKRSLASSSHVISPLTNQENATMRHMASKTTSEEVEAVLFGSSARAYKSSAERNTSSLTNRENAMPKIWQEKEQSTLTHSMETNTTTMESNWPSTHACIFVEVETTQGYVYIGELIHIDAFYNLTLQNAHIWRERLCDVERFLLHQRYTSLYAPLSTILTKPTSPLTSSPSLIHAGANDLLLNSYAERTDSATRPKYIGSVVIRSSNLYMIRFLSEQSNAQDSTSDNSGNTSKDKTSTLTLSSIFKLAASLARKHVLDEKRRNREARRRRRALAATTQNAN